ncbi:hypothetical protein MAUB1S_01826 [Mycolicibacterium aubagnense]
MPTACPDSPDVRAKMRSWVARCTPVFQRLRPLMIQPSPSRTAVVSSQVASLPWSGSVSPNAMDRWPVIIASTHSACCAGVPNRLIMMTCGKFPTIDDSSCRSLCRPSPLCARCSRMTAMSRLVPSRPPNSRGSPYRSQPAASARRRISSSRSSHSRVGTPPFSRSVRANSRRRSKNCMFSRSSGLISASMNASISANRRGRCSGSAKSTVIPLSVRSRTGFSSRWSTVW